MTNPNFTYLALVIDQSGSMSLIEKDMNGGIRTLLKEQAKLPGELRVDVTGFSSRVSKVIEDATIQEVLAWGDLVIPSGMTALLDGVGLAVTDLGSKLDALPEEERPGQVLVVVVTDGAENASQEWTAEAVKALVETQQNDYSWKFLFLGANIDAVSTAANFGISKANSVTYAANTRGTESALRSASAYIGATRSGLDYSVSEKEREEALGNS